VSIKCKKPLERPLGELTCSVPLNPLADGEGAVCPLPKNLTPALGVSGLAYPQPQIFMNKQTNKHARHNADLLVRDGIMAWYNGATEQQRHRQTDKEKRQHLLGSLPSFCRSFTHETNVSCNGELSLFLRVKVSALLLCISPLSLSNMCGVRT